MSSERWFPLLLLAALAGCADLERGPAPLPVDAADTDGAGGDGGAASFSSVRPLLDACRRCHAPGQEAADTGLVLTGDAAAEYATVRRFVDPATAAQSRLLTKASGQSHRGGTIYRSTSPEYAALLAWIQGGAAP